MKKIQDFRVKEYRWLNETGYLLTLYSDLKIEPVLPGNFAEIQVPGTPEVFLRRPISVFDADYENRSITFYIKVAGKGTKKLGELNQGTIVNIIYPLGNSFTVNGSKNVLVVGGGSGIAPFVLLADELKKKNIKTTFLFGARTKKEIVLTREFGRLGKVWVTTEDGSLGEQGLVTQHTVFKDILTFDKIYSCGPDPMMKAVAKIAGENRIDCEVSLENMMACGIGACLCCVTETTSGNKCVCTDGPVFNSKELAWQI